MIEYYDAVNRYKGCKIVEGNGSKTILFQHPPESYSGKLNVADIVTIKASPWNPESSHPVDVVGVIGQTPVFYDGWIERGGNGDEWDNEYLIYYIYEGYLSHMHVSEQNICLLSGQLPDNLAFLGVLSDHLRDVKLIDSDVLSQIYDGNVFVEKVNYYRDYCRYSS